MKFRQERTRGQALVEFALIIPIFVLLLVGIFDLGRGVYAWSTLNNAAREGTRQAIVDQTPAHIRSRAADHSVALGVDETDVVVEFRNKDDTGGCTELTNADPTDDPFVSTCLARVRVNYDFSAVTPIIGNIVGAFAMSGESTMPIDIFCKEPLIASCPRGD
jgi:Flp pilus assembly protein TadG